MADAAAPKKRGRPAKSTTESKEKTEVRIDRLKSFSDFNFLAIYVFLGEKGREETRSTGRWRRIAGQARSWTPQGIRQKSRRLFIQA